MDGLDGSLGGEDDDERISGLLYLSSRKVKYRNETRDTMDECVRAYTIRCAKEYRSTAADVAAGCRPPQRAFFVLLSSSIEARPYLLSRAGKSEKEGEKEEETRG
jgi:hypothetical protein